MLAYDNLIHQRMRQLWPVLVFALFALALGAVPAQATTYYVSPSGSDTNPGTQAAPVRQIRDAIALVKPGDTVLVADGSYLGFDINSVNGTASAPITIQAQGNNAVVTVTTDRSDNRDTIFITYASYIVVDGLNAFNANRAAIRIDHSPHITIQNGVYGNNTTWGIFTDFSDNLLIENNECYGSVQQHGIYVSNSCVNPTVNHNRCHDNYQCGIQLNGDLSEGGTGLVTGAVIEDNIIYNNGVGGGSGINLDGVQNSLIVSNLLYNNHANGISAYKADGAAGPKGDRFYYNTLDMASDSRWGLNLQSTVGPLKVRNNILHNNNTARGGLQYGSNKDVNNTDSDYNIVDQVSPDYGDTVYTLAQWQAQGYEPHSLSASASSLWANPSGGDYHLLPTAPAIGVGEGLAAVATDLDGNPRPTSGASDIDCYEHIGGLLHSLALSPTAETGTGTVTGKVTLTGPAPSNGASISLSNTNSAATVPSSVMVSSGATSQTFTITTTAVSVTQTGDITATYDGDSKSAKFTVLPISVQSVSVSPNPIAGSLTASGKFTLQYPAAPGSITVTLSSSDPSVAEIVDASGNPLSNLTVAAGTQTGSFQVRTSAVSALTDVRISASANGQIKSATLKVRPIGVKAIKLSSTTVKGGSSGQGTVTLEAAAAPGAITVSFTSSDPTVVPAPANITISAGSQTGSFSFSTNAVAANTIVIITATVNGVGKTAKLTVTP